MKALLTGAHGMLGRAIAHEWRERRSDDELILVDRSMVDLRDSEATRRVIRAQSPDLVIHAAAAVGGIADKLAHPSRYLMENLLIDTSVMRASAAAGVHTLVYVGSAAAYPEDAPQPLRPESLFTGRLEAANESYGLAKLAGLTLCRYLSQEFGFSYRAILPANMYGPGENRSLHAGHVIAAALRKAHDAKVGDLASITVWGDGQSRREFVYAPDLAHWLVMHVEHVQGWPAVLNIGAGADESIDGYYEAASRIVGFDGALVHDLGRPNGTRRRLLDSEDAFALGWAPRTSLDEGLARCYEDFLAAATQERRRDD